MSTRGDILQSLVSIVRTNLKSQSGLYKAGVATVLDHDINTLATSGTETPMVMVIDSGRERPVVEDGSRFRFELEVQLRGFVKCSTGEQAITKIYEVMTDLLTLIYSAPSIHADVLEWRHISSEGVRHDWKSGAADILITTRLTYTLEKEEPDDIAVTVPGTSWISAIADLLYDRLNALGVNLYRTHSLASITLPAISIGYASSEHEEKARGESVGIDSHVSFAIRVHTAYSEGFSDSSNVQTLLNAVINQLYRRIHLQNTPIQWQIEDIGDVQSRVLFDESRTIGGQVTVVVNGIVEHTQE